MIYRVQLMHNNLYFCSIFTHAGNRADAVSHALSIFSELPDKFSVEVHAAGSHYGSDLRFME